MRAKRNKWELLAQVDAYSPEDDMEGVWNERANEYNARRDAILIAARGWRKGGRRGRWGR